MSDYEMLNQKVAAQKAVRRRDALRRLAYLLAIVLAVSGTATNDKKSRLPVCETGKRQGNNLRC